MGEYCKGKRMAGGSAMESIRSKLLSPGSSAKLGSFNSQKVPKNCLLHMVPLTQGNWFYQSRFKIQISWLFFKNSDFTSDLNPIYAQIAKKLPSPIYKLLAQFYMDQNFPRHLFIETTAACNLKCSYCPREKISNHMEWNIFTRIIDEAREHGPRSFSLHLFGEPFLWPNLFPGIGYIKTSHPRNTILLTTNGTLLERNGNLDRLLASEVDQVLWSWRPEVTFKEETKKRVAKWGKFRVRFINELVPDEEKEAWQDWPNKEERGLHNYGGEINLSQWTTKSQDKLPKKEPERHPCYHLWLAPAVAWNGNFLLCCADAHQKEVIGKFPEMSIKEAWNSEKLKS